MDLNIKNPDRVITCDAIHCLYNEDKFCKASMIMHDERGICRIFMPKETWDKIIEQLKDIKQ